MQRYSKGANPIPRPSKKVVHWRQSEVLQSSQKNYPRNQEGTVVKIGAVFLSIEPHGRGDLIRQQQHNVVPIIKNKGE